MTTLLFDLDGTITDTIPLLTATYRRVFEEMGLPWQEKELLRLIGLPLREIARQLVQDRVDEFYRLYQHYYRQRHDQLIRLYPGTMEALIYLRRAGYKMGVVTSKGRPGTEMALCATGIKDFFDVIITAYDVKEHKPHPQPVLAALAGLAARPQESVYVGDSVFDWQAGRAAGVRVVAVTWGVNSREEIVAQAADLVDVIVSSWDEFIRWLDGQNL